jgi:hypothetical protein
MTLLSTRRTILVLAAAALSTFAAWADPAVAQHPEHGQGTPTPAQQTTEGFGADIEVFRTQFLAVDQSYSATARAEAEARLAVLEQDIARVSPAYFELETARIAALADNGHTFAVAGPRSRRYNRIMLRLTPFGEGFFVLRATAENSDLLGGRLVSIDGHDTHALSAAARTLVGGTNAWRDRSAGYLFESPDLLNALGLSRDAGAASYRFRLPNGRMITRRLTAESARQRAPANAFRWMFPATTELGDADWRGALAVEQAPWSLLEPSEPFRWRMAPEVDGMVIELRQTNDAEGRPIGDFLAEMEGEIRAGAPVNLVLDLRFNGGGNLNTTRGFVQRLPSHVSGRIFVLTSPWTFSAAISTTAYLKQAAPDRVTIIGEEVGDRLVFFAEGDFVTLPNSHVMLHMATERHDYETGCQANPDCHSAVSRHPIEVATLTPDIPTPWTIQHYLDGRDPAMEAVTAALAR